MNAIETQLIITSIRAKVDGSLGLNATTPELSNTEKVEFLNLQNITLKALLQPEELDGITSIEKEIDGKTSGQRLRSVLFVLWKQHPRKEDFEIFYRNQMERFIEAVKSKLEGPEE